MLEKKEQHKSRSPGAHRNNSVRCSDVVMRQLKRQAVGSNVSSCFHIWVGNWLPQSGTRPWQKGLLKGWACKKLRRVITEEGCVTFCTINTTQSKALTIQEGSPESLTSLSRSKRKTALQKGPNGGIIDTLLPIKLLSLVFPSRYLDKTKNEGVKSGCSGALKLDRLGLSCKANICNDTGTGDLGVLSTHETSPMKMKTLEWGRTGLSSLGCLRPRRGKLNWWCRLNPPRVNADASTSK